MKIPKFVNIAGHKIGITIKQVLYDSEENQCAGLAFPAEGRIEVAKTCNGSKMSDDEKNEAFLHEIIHHISLKYSINLKESQVISLGVGMYQVLKDNKLSFF